MADLMGLGVPDSDSARKDELIEDADVQGRTSVFELEFLQKLMLPENRYGVVAGRSISIVMGKTNRGRSRKNLRHTAGN